MPLFINFKKFNIENSIKRRGFYKYSPIIHWAVVKLKKLSLLFY